MGGVLEVVAPVFALIALGYVTARRNWLDEDAFRGLTLFVFALASPALLFSGGTRPHGSGAAGAVLLVVVCVAVYALALLGARRFGRMTLADAALFALACVFGNSVMMGVPLVFAAYGEAGMRPLLPMLAFQTITLLGLATIMAEVGLNAAAPWRRLLRATAAGVGRNPVVMAVFAALVWNLLGLPVPDVVRRTLDLLGASAPPLALFCLGGGLAGLAAGALWKETAAIALIKLLALPAVAWVAARAAGLPPLEEAVAVTVAALPTGANAFILARRYATGADRSGSAVVVTTALSVLTLSAVIGHYTAMLR